MYQVSDGVRSTRNQDGGVLLDIQRGKILRLNFTGALILEQLQQGQSQSQIADGISQEFSISREVVHRDVDDFMKSLEQQHLLFDDGLEELP